MSKEPAAPYDPYDQPPSFFSRHAALVWAAGVFLATAVLTANNGFPTALGDLATAEWANMDELTSGTTSSAFTEFVSLLSSVFGN